MLKFHTRKNGDATAELDPGYGIISDTDDILDVIAEASFSGCNKLIVHSVSLNPGFFDLRTGLAGDILQKFSNYRMELAIIGDFSVYKSKSLRDFIRESNRTGVITFKETLEDALKK
ncbi:MAG: DUF4180 domain-containing protein [Bacteroidales bacterium]|nr:DUF4180 domain-containing protein [Bacteroidales bacterium]